MPRYFIDIHDGANHVKDTVGFDLPDQDAAREKLVRIMSKIAQGFTLMGERQDFLAIVRDEAGKMIYRAHLSLDIEPCDTI